MLKKGSKGSLTKAWQSHLDSRGYRLAVIDGIFGGETDHHTRQWQLAHGIDDDGVLGPSSYSKALEDGMEPFQWPYPIVPAKWFTVANDRYLDLIVIHSMEVPEVDNIARRVANGFAQRPRERAASAHYCIDNKEIIQSVMIEDVAWAAPGANARGIHLEHAGYARQSADEWSDEYSAKMLELSAVLSGRICALYGIPCQWLDTKALAVGGRGITGHYEVTMALNNGRGHVDPGPSFPRERYIEMVSEAMKHG